MQQSNVLEREDFWQTAYRGNNSTEYEIYLGCADDGNGGDITNDGEPLKSYDEWLGN